MGAALLLIKKLKRVELHSRRHPLLWRWVSHFHLRYSLSLPFAGKSGTPNPCHLCSSEDITLLKLLRKLLLVLLDYDLREISPKLRRWVEEDLPTSMTTWARLTFLQATSTRVTVAHSIIPSHPTPPLPMERIFSAISSFVFSIYGICWYDKDVHTWQCFISLTWIFSFLNLTQS